MKFCFLLVGLQNFIEDIRVIGSQEWPILGRCKKEAPLQKRNYVFVLYKVNILDGGKVLGMGSFPWSGHVVHASPYHIVKA